MEVIYSGYNEDYDFGDNNTWQTESEIRVYFINLLLQQLDYISQLILQGTIRLLQTKWYDDTGLVG